MHSLRLLPFTRRVLFLVMGATLLGAAGCTSTAPEGTGITRESWGSLPDGTPVDLYTLRNSNGAVAKLSNYGGIVTSLEVPDRDGRMGDVVLGYDQLSGYLAGSPYFGCLVGRYANRIAGGRFKLDDTTYTLATNNGPNHLHGGIQGFDKKVWQARPIPSVDAPALVLTYVSPDGEEGYPGTLTVQAIYTLTRENGLRLDYTARTDRKTVLNLTQHSYFNLAGSGDILGHVIEIPAESFTPVDATLIPTGEIRSVVGTPLDFRTPTAIGSRIEADDEQMRLGGGYDHNWVFKKEPGQLTLLARVTDPVSGRVLEVLSTEPGMQFYTGNFLDGTLTGKGGWVYQRRHAFCLEPQHYPDSPNQPKFPSVTLKPGEIYRNTIIYRFPTPQP